MYNMHIILAVGMHVKPVPTLCGEGERLISKLEEWGGKEVEWV